MPTVGIVVCGAQHFTARSANGEAEQRSIGADRNAIAGDAGLKALRSPTRRNVWLTEPDTMDMVSTDEGDGIRGDPPRRPSGVGWRSGRGSRGFGKKRTF